jgi:hypothetical protein
MYDLLRIPIAELPAWPRQISLLKWLAPLGFALIAAVWINIAGYQFVVSRITGPLVLSFVIFAIGWLFYLWRRNIGAFVFTEALSFLIVFSMTACVLDYLMLSSSKKFPLVDRHLSQIDHALGFDWIATFTWVKAHPTLDHILNFAYGCWTPEWVVLPALLAYREDGRARELISLGVISIIVMMPLTAVLPALSAYPYYMPMQALRFDWVQHIMALRAGIMQTLDLNDMTGLVSVPSFHTVGAVLFMYACRNIKFLFPVSVVLNTTIIVSTITAGSHHLVDILAGLLLVGVTIHLYRKYVSHV